MLQRWYIWTKFSLSMRFKRAKVRPGKWQSKSVSRTFREHSWGHPREHSWEHSSDHSSEQSREHSWDHSENMWERTKVHNFAFGHCLKRSKKGRCYLRHPLLGHHLHTKFEHCWKYATHFQYLACYLCYLLPDQKVRRSTLKLDSASEIIISAWAAIMLH